LVKRGDRISRELPRNKIEFESGGRFMGLGPTLTKQPGIFSPFDLMASHLCEVY
jgi:hypothetical protein